MSRIALVLAISSSLLAHELSLGTSTGPHSSSKGVSAEEREVLVAIYSATQGTNWKNHEGWLGPSGSECRWHGVLCDSGVSELSTISELDLSRNNLRGSIPEAIGKLSHLQTLFLDGNTLSGQLPGHVIRQWLSGSLWVRAEAPLLTDVSEIDYEFAASAILCARHRVVFRSDATATKFIERCRNSSPEDRNTFCEVENGRIWGEEFGRLAWSLEKNGYFSLRASYERNITDSAFVSTRVTRNGKKYEVIEYAGGGPLELWTIHRAIEGVSSMMEWTKSGTVSACPHWENSQRQTPN